MQPITIVSIIIIVIVCLAAAALTAVLLARKRKDESPNKIVSAGIARHAKLYDGMYEGLCQILTCEDVTERDALKEWCGRTSRIEGEEEYTSAFRETFESALDAPEDEYRKALSLLLSCIYDAGVERIEEKTVVYDAAARDSYLFLGNVTPSDGDICRVVKPCWIFEDQTVEQGIIMKG